MKEYYYREKHGWKWVSTIVGEDFHAFYLYDCIRQQKEVVPMIPIEVSENDYHFMVRYRPSGVYTDSSEKKKKLYRHFGIYDIN